MARVEWDKALRRGGIVISFLAAIAGLGDSLLNVNPVRAANESQVTGPTSNICAAANETVLAFDNLILRLDDLDLRDQTPRLKENSQYIEAKQIKSECDKRAAIATDLHDQKGVGFLRILVDGLAIWGGVIAGSSILIAELAIRPYRKTQEEETLNS